MRDPAGNLPVPADGASRAAAHGPARAREAGARIVEEVGPTEASGIAVGDRVAVPWLGYACGQCPYCNDGRETLCARQLRTGDTIDGSYADYVLGYARHVVKVPNGSTRSTPPRSRARG